MRNTIDLYQTSLKVARKSDFLSSIIALPFLLVTFTVSIEPWMAYAQIGLVAICSFVYILLCDKKQIRISKLIFILCLFYTIPWLLSISFGYLNSLVSQSHVPYRHLNPFGRLTNIIMLGTLLLLFGLEDSRSNIYVEQKIVKYYFFSLCILLFFAFWQIADIYLGFPIDFPFNTRSHLHSRGGLELSIQKRITSFASEPSFLAPYIVEGIVLSSVLIQRVSLRYVMILLFLVVGVLSFSPSTYISLLAYGITFILFRNRKMWLIVICVLLLVFLPFNFSKFQEMDSFQYFFVRLKYYTDSGRFEGIALPIKYMLENGGFFSVLLGFGVSSMGAFYESGHPMFPFGTSNTVFADLLFECGILGLFSYVAIFVTLFVISIRVQKRTLVPLFLSVNFLVASLYRGEYATLHFISNVILIYIFSTNLIKQRYEYK